MLLTQQEASGNLKSEEEGSPGEGGEKGGNEPVWDCLGILKQPGQTWASIQDEVLVPHPWMVHPYPGIAQPQILLSHKSSPSGRKHTD